MGRASRGEIFSSKTAIAVIFFLASLRGEKKSGWIYRPGPSCLIITYVELNITHVDLNRFAVISFVL
jgi:hypothetical protein